MCKFKISHAQYSVSKGDVLLNLKKFNKLYLTNEKKIQSGAQLLPPKKGNILISVKIIGNLMNTK